MQVFGDAPNGLVHKIELQSGDVRASILTLGAIVSEFRIGARSVVLGADTLELYLGPMGYFGAIVGRVANRIKGAEATINGRVYALDPNEPNGNCLHGGCDGAAQQVWDILDHNADCVRLGLTLADGHMGFPGNLDVTAEYRLVANGLRLSIEAVSDAVTFCNFAPHSYFNLGSGPDAKGHTLRIASKEYLLLDEVNTPSGEVATVAGTEFDFRDARVLGGTRVDHNFCLSRQSEPLRPVAWLASDDTELELATTAPGLQVYTGAHLDDSPVTGRGGLEYRASAGIALEPQAWPDAPHHPDFPSIELHPGETYRSIIEYRLRRLDSA